jgi:hypothetical protein
MKVLGVAMTAVVGVAMAVVLAWAGRLLAADANVQAAKAPVPAAAAAPAPAVLYTKDAPPPTPKLGDLPLQDSVTQYGITWTFEKRVPVGRFVNGDFYVVGTAKVVGIDPKPLLGKDVPADQVEEWAEKRVSADKRIRNGSMLNPPDKGEVSYDSRTKNIFKPELVSAPPYDLKPGDVLVSTISLKMVTAKKDGNDVLVGENSSFSYHSGGRFTPSSDNCPTKVAAVLTCAAAPLPPDAFRPSYCDHQQKIYLARDLRRDQLPKLAPEKGAPDPVKFADAFGRCWLNTGFFGFDEPMENMPHYGQWVGQASSVAGLLLCSDFTPEQKERLLVNLTQVGIDYWGLVRGGHTGWPAWGGHGSGRKFPIVFAGWALGDDEMMNLAKGFPKVCFGEDEQTAYGECWTGAKVVFAGHSGIDAATGIGRDKGRGGVWGPYEHMHPVFWNKDQFQSEAYRRCCSSNSFVGQALALRVLKIEKAWGHDAFFDYVDRWMTEDDKPFRAEINQWYKAHFHSEMTSEDPGKEWAHEGYANDPWVKAMWTKYRSQSVAPTDGWKTAKPSTLPPASMPSPAQLEEKAK